MESIIITQGLTRQFAEKTAVDQLTLEVRRGEIFGLLGHNGAGKTTTIRMLNGVLTPNAGSAEVLGMNPIRDGAKLRQRTGVLTESPALDDRLSARDSLRFHAAIYGIPTKDVNRRVDAVLARFGLLERADDRIGTYSRGMRQRAALARTILHEPELIFLDEPTSGLDPVAIREVQQMITHLSREEGRTIILCTHNLIEAQRLCHRVAVMAQGKLLAAGAPAELGERFGYANRLQIEVYPNQASHTVEVLQRLYPTLEINTTQAADGHLHLQGVGRRETPAMVTALVSQGIALFRVNPEEASLEDVYFALQGVKE